MTERRPKLGTWLGVAAVVLIGISMVVVFSRGFGKDPSLVASPLIGKPVPADTLSLLDGDGQVDLAQTDGDVLVINFFASWCFPCRQEHPVFEAAAEDYAGASVKFIGVVYQDEPDNATSFLDAFGRAQGETYVVDPESRTAVNFGVYGVPETFFVSPDGIIMAKKTGPISMTEMMSTINTILAGGTPADLNEGATQSQ